MFPFTRASHFGVTRFLTHRFILHLGQKTLPLELDAFLGFAPLQFRKYGAFQLESPGFGDRDEGQEAGGVLCAAEVSRPF